MCSGTCEGEERTAIQDCVASPTYSNADLPCIVQVCTLVDTMVSQKRIPTLSGCQTGACV